MLFIKYSTVNIWSGSSKP